MRRTMYMTSIFRYALIQRIYGTLDAINKKTFTVLQFKKASAKFNIDILRN